MIRSDLLRAYWDFPALFKQFLMRFRATLSFQAIFVFDTPQLFTGFSGSALYQSERL
jgi:hypothetical protein